MRSLRIGHVRGMALCGVLLGVACGDAPSCAAGADAQLGGERDGAVVLVDAGPLGPQSLRDLASAAHAVCGIDTAGRLLCWGDSAGLGMLGDGDEGPHALLSPSQVGTASDWQALAAGPYLFCATKRAGDIHCWGHARTPGLATASVARAVLAAPTRTDLAYSALALGEYHACGLGADGVLSCWGDNGHGQLGAALPLRSDLPRAVDGRYTQAAVGTHHSCALGADRGLYCFGSNLDGEAGQPLPVERVLAPTQVGSARDYTAVSCAGARCCARHEDGAAACWGRGVDTLFGSAALPDATAGLWRIQASGSFASLTVLDDGICGVDAAGAALCWTGAGSDGATASTQRIDGADPQARLVGGAGHRCLLTNGAAHCWGDAPAEGVLGRGVPTAQARYVRLDDGWRALGITAHGGCGITSVGALRCWGRGAHSGSADGFASSDPIALLGEVSALSVAYAHDAAASHVCGVFSSKVYCWGAGDSGQLGDGRAVSSRVPVPVALPEGVQARSVSAGEGTSCAISTDDALYCWGDNRFGQVGVGASHASHAAPVALASPAAHGWKSVSVAGQRVSALRDDGSVWVWGDGSGMPASATPQRLGGYAGFRAVVTSSESETCALSVTGSLYCSAVLDGTAALTAVANGRYFDSIFDAPNGVCGIDLAGAPRCFMPRRAHAGHAAHAAGWDEAVGIGGDPRLPLPDGPVSALAGGYALRCALTPDGARLCAGVRTDENFGAGPSTDLPLPVTLLP